MSKVTVNRATTSSTGVVKSVCVISTLNGLGEVAKITPNHLTSTNTLEMAARPTDAKQAGSDMELTGVATHT